MQLLDQAAPDFNDPIGLLLACHERMLGMCDLLERMVEYQQEKGVDADMAESAKKLLNYFDTAAPHHHADEDEDLFPHLQEIEGAGVLLKALTAQHGLHDMLWSKLRVCLEKLAEQQECAQLGALSQTFVSAYRAHIEIENDRLLPMAAQALSDDQLKAIGASMAARRGVSPD